MADGDDLEAFLVAGHDRRIERWKEFVRIASVSAQPEHADGCRRAAEWLAADLIAAGLEHVASRRPVATLSYTATGSARPELRP